MTRFLLLGSNGQLGTALQPVLGGLGEVTTAARAGADHTVDLASGPDFGALLTATGADVVVNAAAWTAVDAAESDASGAAQVNHVAVAALARACAERHARLLHFSTDYVFDGGAGGAYTETDPTAPVGVYGRTKLAGEAAMRESGVSGLLLRTSWVYGEAGSNFFLTMLRLAMERRELRVVADQFGVPNWTRALAQRTGAALNAHLEGRVPWPDGTALYHLSASGRTNWHTFATSIFDEVRRQAPAAIADALIVDRVEAIGTADYPTPAQRPANSELDASAFHARYALPRTDWRDELAGCVRAWLDTRS